MALLLTTTIVVASTRSLAFTLPGQKTRLLSASLASFETLAEKPSLEDGRSGFALAAAPAGADETAGAPALEWDVDESDYDADAVVKAVIQTALTDQSSSSALPMVLDPAANETVAEAVGDLTTTKAQYETVITVEKPVKAPTLGTVTGAKPLKAPSVAEILRFAIPATGIWMCGPLLSLIDTASVGVLSGTVQQAALSPAVAVTDYSATFVAFMYTATTNLVASSRDAAADTRESKTRRSIVASLQLSTFVGLGLGSLLFAFSRPILVALTGSIDPHVFAASLRYVRIRALGAPAAVLIGSAQSASLGMKDVRSPLGVLLVAAVVNCLGDLLFVPNSNRWVGGAAGAGWATVISQYVAATLFLRWLMSKPKSPQVIAPAPTSTADQTKHSSGETSLSLTQKTPVDLSDSILELVGTKDRGESKPRQERLSETLRSSSAASNNSAHGQPVLKKLKAFSNLMLASSKKKKTESTPTTRGVLAGFGPSDLVKLPPLKMVKKFLPYVVPVSTASFGRLSIYMAMNHVVASTMGTTAMAAQQIVLSFFSCLAPAADSLSHTGQACIPTLHQQPKGWSRAAALRQATLNFWKAGSLFGAILALAAASMPLISVLFTTDPSVIATASSVVPMLALVCALHAVFNATEGLLLGQRDLGFLGRIYALIFVAAPWFVLRVKKASAPNLRSVWGVLCYYQVLRVGAFILRSWAVQRRTERQEAERALK